jgi:hypothetical protein
MDLKDFFLDAEKRCDKSFGVPFGFKSFVAVTVGDEKRDEKLIAFAFFGEEDAFGVGTLEPIKVGTIVANPNLSTVSDFFFTALERRVVEPFNGAVEKVGIGDDVEEQATSGGRVAVGAEEKPASGRRVEAGAEEVAQAGVDVLTKSCLFTIFELCRKSVELFFKSFFEFIS